MVREALKRAVDKFGSEAKLGEATGYSQNAIWQAKQRGRITAEMALRIEKATGVSRRDLCPEFPWDEAASEPAGATA